MFKIKLILIFFIVGLPTPKLQAQEIRTQQGVVFKMNTTVRIAHATVVNKQNNYVVSSNDFGIFRIVANKGDTLTVEATGCKPSIFIVNDFSDALVYLKETRELEEVIIRRNSVRQDLAELSRDYRKKGVFYRGRPPLYLILFKPLTFFSETFGRTGKQARRFNNFANRELEYQEIVRKFNDYTIKNVVAITQEELPDFKTDYLPTVEQVRRWSDYDVMAYIRRSYTEFKAKRETGKN